MSPQKKRPTKKKAGDNDADVGADIVEIDTRQCPDQEEAWEALKRLTRQQLEFAGWIDEVETQCRRIAEEDAGDVIGESATIRHEQLLDGVREPMLRSVPDHIKARVLKDIRDKLLLMRDGDGNGNGSGDGSGDGNRNGNGGGAEA